MELSVQVFSMSYTVASVLYRFLSFSVVFHDVPSYYINVPLCSSLFHDYPSDSPWSNMGLSNKEEVKLWQKMQKQAKEGSENKADLEGFEASKNVLQVC